MNRKANALEMVRVRAESYFQDRDAARSSHKLLVDAIKDARVADATQQAITDACYIDAEHKLSRQRIAQLAEGSNE